MKIDLKGVNRSDLARKCGMTTSGISRILSGERAPSVSAAIRIANALDTDIDNLLASLPDNDKAAVH